MVTVMCCTVVVACLFHWFDGLIMFPCLHVVIPPCTRKKPFRCACLCSCVWLLHSLRAMFPPCSLSFVAPLACVLFACAITRQGASSCASCLIRRTGTGLAWLAALALLSKTSFSHTCARGVMMCTDVTGHRQHSSSK